MARKSRELSGTGIYHVMMRGTNRQDIFEDGDDYLRFLGILRNMVYPVNDAGEPLPQRCHFYAYCLMTNQTSQRACPSVMISRFLLKRKYHDYSITDST